MYLLDTNVVSQARRIAAGRADERFERWISSIEPTLAYVSAVTIMELEIGVMRLERRDPSAGAVLRQWLNNDVSVAFEGRILPVDTETARFAATLHVPDPAPAIDALVAATALANAMSVVTRNTGDFSRFDDVHVINPWDDT
ncbi:MAG: type II toxin-antitoxin system VapC family toxin [Acidimicrobiaceae bacterium]|nr:type II toxin-antitoxin system VapC family toxin [Acidimicrobiaceae bacterium]